MFFLILRGKCILLKAIETDVSNVISIVKSIKIHHNFVQQHEPFHPDDDENLIAEFDDKLRNRRPTQN
jgi:hypothetical protein